MGLSHSPAERVSDPLGLLVLVGRPDAAARQGSFLRRGQAGGREPDTQRARGGLGMDIAIHGVGCMRARHFQRRLAHAARMPRKIGMAARRARFFVLFAALSPQGWLRKAVRIF